MNTKPWKNAVVAVCLVGCLGAWLAAAQSTYEPYTFTTIAGTAGIKGYEDGTNAAAQFNSPNGVAVDSSGNVYVTEWNNHTVRKLTPVGTNWVVTTLAGQAGISGSADGTNSSAQFYYPVGIAVDSAGNVYVVDLGNSTIRKLTPVGTDWVVTTIAGQAGSLGRVDGAGIDARFNYPFGIAVDSASNLYIADQENFAIRKMTLVGTDWMVTTIAGQAGSAGSADGINGKARFHEPCGVAVDAAGNVYVGDSDNNTIRKATPVGTNWVVTTIAGQAGGSAGSADGLGSGTARFNAPNQVAVDRAGNIYVTEWNNNTIRKVRPSGLYWVVTTLAGQAGVTGSSDGPGSSARFFFPSYVTVDSAGSVYVADNGNGTIRKGCPALAVTSSGASFGFKGGQFGFGLTGPAGLSAVVESSPDLVNWLPIWTNSFVLGLRQFSDPNSGVYAHCFYRTRTP